MLLLTPPPTAADTVSLLAALRVGGATLVIGPSVGCAGGAAHCTARLRPDLVVASRGAYVRWRLALLFRRWTRGETSGTTPPLLPIDRLPAFGSEEGGSYRAMPRHGLPTAPPSGGGGQPGPVAIVAAATRESAARAVCDDAATEVASADALRRRADAYGRALALALPRSRPFGLSSAVGPFGRDADRAPTAVGGAGAWRSLHLGSLHLALDDLLLGGTAVLHPRATVPAGGNLPLLNADNSAAAWATGVHPRPVYRRKHSLTSKRRAPRPRCSKVLCRHTLTPVTHASALFGRRAAPHQSFRHQCAHRPIRRLGCAGCELARRQPSRDRLGRPLRCATTAARRRSSDGARAAQRSVRADASRAALQAARERRGHLVAEPFCCAMLSTDLTRVPRMTIAGCSCFVLEHARRPPFYLLRSANRAERF